jgi:hypothetical protein
MTSMPKRRALVAANDNWTCGPRTELTLEEFLPALLSSAKRGLRRKSIDEAHLLWRWLEKVPPDNWPSEMFVWRFKRRPGRMHSAEADAARFWRNPVKVAALLAQGYVASWRKENRGRTKLELPDGRKFNVREAAVALAAWVNASLAKASSGPCRKIAEKDVQALFAKDRIRPPAS